MRIADLTPGQVSNLARGPGLALDLGAARVRVRSSVEGLQEALRVVYGAFPVADEEGFFEVTATLRSGSGLRSLVRPQVRFAVDGVEPFEPFPAATHLPLLEWGINYVLAERFNHVLMLHAGVVARDGDAVLLPAVPGSGKSTLTAALMLSGYRLLSDEFGVVDLGTSRLRPLLKAVALKNASIDVISRRFPGATLGPRFEGTRKGTVAHLAPDAPSVANRAEPARARLIVFPRFQAGAETLVEPYGQAQAFAKMVSNSFNYDLLGAAGFDAAARLISRCRCCRLTFSDLGEAVATVGRLLDEARSLPVAALEA